MQGVLVPRGLLDTLMFEHCVQFGETAVQPVPPIHTPLDHSVIAHVSIKVLQ